jgi:hypothetical protein
VCVLVATISLHGSKWAISLHWLVQAFTHGAPRTWWLKDSELIGCAAPGRGPLRGAAARRRGDQPQISLWDDVVRSDSWRCSAPVLAEASYVYIYWGLYSTTVLLRSTIIRNLFPCPLHLLYAE